MRRAYRLSLLVSLPTLLIAPPAHAQEVAEPTTAAEEEGSVPDETIIVTGTRRSAPPRAG